MRRRQNSHSPMSLFPFLDTLVCTMGSLILMLLAMTPKIKERAEARELARRAALAPQAAVEPDPEPEPEPLPVVSIPAPAPAIDIAGINSAHDAERKRRRSAWFRSLDEARQALAKKQAEFRQLRELLNEADAKLKTIDDQTLQARLKSETAAEASRSLADRKVKLEEQEAQVAQAIALTRKNIDLANRKQASSKNEYSLVPYDGSSGTVRRPIYIECTARGFRFLPEDETVSPADLAEFHRNYNPLLTGTKSLVQFWTRRQRTSAGNEPEPYVLLLVRPSGSVHFYIARECLSSLGLNFGYELIEEDWNLSLPEPNPVAKAVLKETLDLTIQSQRPAADSLAELRGGGSSFNEAAGNHLSGAYPSRANGAGGGGRSGRGSPSPDGSATRGAGDPGSESGDDNLAGVLAGLSKNRNAPGLGGRGGGAGDISGRPAGRRPAGLSGRDSDNFAPGGAGGGGGQFASRAGSRGGIGGDPGDPEFADGSAPDGSSPDGSRSSNGGRLGGGPRSRLNGRGGARPATLGGSGSSLGGGGPGDDDLPPELSADYIPSRLRGPDGAGGTSAFGDPQGDPNGTDGGGPSRFESRGGRSRKGQASGGNPAASRFDSSGDPDDPAAGGSSSADPGTPGATGGGQSSQVQMGGPGATISLGGGKKRKSTDKDDPDDGPRISAEDSRSGGMSGRASGPRKWGQAHRKASIGFEKKVVIRVWPNRIVIGNNDIVIGVGRADSNDEIVHQVVAGIDHTADGWGEPPANFYWVPVAKFIVAPGGASNYEKVHAVLDQKWGISSTVEYEPEAGGGKSAGGGRK
jgi:hypothetical protein